ncbi:MAG: phosphoenolpyruvate--protein phosphotransferase [Alphaproteobacteria bacterium]|nr:MAG: phosphoenolpyruvate--protein phosphotransferase [Alphaproteobacteria bacterium]
MADGTSPQRVIVGTPAADGLAIGRVLLQIADAGAQAVQRQVRDPASEHAALAAAIDRARADIADLIERQDKLAGDILAFQLALLEDDDLIAPILESVAAGQPAHDAWCRALEREIAEYRADGDTYLAARAEDLRDLRDRVLGALAGRSATAPTADEGTTDAILVADDLTPSRFLELDWTRMRGAAIRGGSRTSHVAILARARGVPLVVGLQANLDQVSDGTPALLDAEAGRLILRPDRATLATARSRLNERSDLVRAAVRLIAQAATTAGGERVHVLINVDDPAILETLNPAHCDGIGLTRTEFLFQDGRLPDEEAQFAVYRRIVAWADGRPVTIRTLDAGGDKPIPGLTPDGEANPFLGIRGVRLSLVHEKVFRTQLRALARAAAFGPLKVMVPMVTVPGEMAAVRRLLREAVAELAAQGTPHAQPALGMMVEVPAAALDAARFEADFYSIGSNDLIQYVLAVARDNPALEHLVDPTSPAVLELIRRTVAAARTRGVEVSLCGDMASDPSLIPHLLDCGLRTLSVAPARIGRIKLAIRAYGGTSHTGETKAP